MKKCSNKISQESSLNLSRHLTSFYHDISSFRTGWRCPNCILSHVRNTRNHRAHRFHLWLFADLRIILTLDRGQRPSPLPEKVYRCPLLRFPDEIISTSRCDRIPSEESGSLARNRLPVLTSLSSEIKRNRKCPSPLSVNFFRGTIEERKKENTRDSKEKRKKFAFRSVIDR